MKSAYSQSFSGLESLIIIGVVIGFFVYKANDFSSTDSSVNSHNIQSCVGRGINYFKEIGSYPFLQNEPNAGRRAEDVARERCNRGTNAF